MVDIIHEYKGCKIEKVINYYFQGSEIFYRCDGLHFERLKDAKEYIDRMEGKKE